MLILEDSVFLTGDNVDAFSGRIGQNVPSWARHVQLQLTSVDHDAVYSATVGGFEAARAKTAEIHSADNTQSVDWRKGGPVVERRHFLNKDAPRVIMNVDITTGSTFIAWVRFTS